jgi:hypothetical protein
MVKDHIKQNTIKNIIIGLNSLLFKSIDNNENPNLPVRVAHFSILTLSTIKLAVSIPILYENNLIPNVKNNMILTDDNNGILFLQKVMNPDIFTFSMLKYFVFK